MFNTLQQEIKMQNLKINTAKPYTYSELSNYNAEALTNHLQAMLNQIEGTKPYLVKQYLGDLCILEYCSDDKTHKYYSQTDKWNLNNIILAIDETWHILNNQPTTYSMLHQMQANRTDGFY